MIRRVLEALKRRFGYDAAPNVPGPRWLPHEVGAYYDEWTGRYEESFGDTFQAQRPANLEDLHMYVLERAGIKDGQSILDAGAGVAGPSLFFARKRDVRIDAVTISAVQADIARRRVSEAGLGHRLHVTHGDYHELPTLFPPESFDVALYLESFSHSHDPHLAARALYPVLKPGGVVYIKDYFLKVAGDRGERERAEEVTRFSDEHFKTNIADSARVKSCLLEAGFVELWTQDVTFKRDHAVWEEFSRRHGFKLFGEGDPFEWSAFLELKYQKPVAIRG